MSGKLYIFAYRLYFIIHWFDVFGRTVLTTLWTKLSTTTISLATSIKSAHRLFIFYSDLRVSTFLHISSVKMIYLLY